MAAGHAIEQSAAFTKEIFHFVFNACRCLISPCVRNLSHDYLTRGIRNMARKRVFTFCARRNGNLTETLNRAKNLLAIGLL